MSVSKNKNTWFRVGVGLFILACVTWLGVLVVPILNISSGLKVSLAAGAIVVGEIFFWTGALLTGKEFIKKIMGCRK